MSNQDGWIHYPSDRWAKPTYPLGVTVRFRGEDDQTHEGEIVGLWIDPYIYPGPISEEMWCYEVTTESTPTGIATVMWVDILEVI